MLTELDVVNECLASMGRSPLQSLAASSSPIVASARESFRRANLTLQKSGWYFNTERIKLPADVNTDSYPVPSDVLALRPQVNPPWLTIRGRVLYDNRIGGTLPAGAPLDLTITRLVPFSDLPIHAQDAISAATVIDFQNAYDGDQIKIREAEKRRDAAMIELNAEHTRVVQANMLTDGATGMRRHHMQYITHPRRRY